MNADDEALQLLPQIDRLGEITPALFDPLRRPNRLETRRALDPAWVAISRERKRQMFAALVQMVRGFARAARKIEDKQRRLDRLACREKQIPAIDMSLRASFRLIIGANCDTRRRTKGSPNG